MTEYLCNEPIIAVYEGVQELSFADFFLDYCNEFAFHVTPGARLILETEGFYISLTANGVISEKKHPTLDDLRRAGERIDPCAYHLENPDIAFVEFAHTLFVGERLTEVKQVGGHYELRFDDFDFKIVPHECNENDFPSLIGSNRQDYRRVLGMQRYLKKKCACGGTGELLLNFLFDFTVRCNKCKQATLPDCADGAIRSWQEGDREYDLSNINLL